MIIKQFYDKGLAHSPGSLDGKNISPGLQNTIRCQVEENHALQHIDKTAPVKLIIAGQPFVPKYVAYDTEPDKAAAPGHHSSSLRIVTTADGSNTIYNAAVGEHYHSRNGALQESLHVFINAGLHYFLTLNNAAAVSILEVGFGTGLNFLLSADACISKKIPLRYTGIEAYPLSPAMMGQTGYNQYVPAGLWDNYINQYPCALTGSTAPDNYCQLKIAAGKLMDFTSNEQFDIIYFDAFASASQPEMWQQDAIGHAISFLKPGGVFVTYAITGNLKRMLKGMGFTIEKIPGAAGKREMLRATSGKP